MAMLPVIKARIENGRILWKDTLTISKIFSTYNNKDVVVVIQPEKQRRSLKQNSYYHAVVVKLIADKLGYSEKETNEILKSLFLTVEYEVKLSSKKTITIKTSKSTKELSTAGMEDFLSRVRQWASEEIDLFIPLPNEVIIEYGNYGE